MKTMRTLLLITLIVGISGIALARGDQEAGSAGSPTLTYWVPLGELPSQYATTWDDIPIIQVWQENTGVDVEFQHPPQGQQDEQFNLMVASNELPDMVETDWLGFPGGPDKAINDGVILELTDVIEDHAPNLAGLLASNPDWDKLVKTDSGSYYVFPFIRGDEILMTWNGPQMRADWLRELGMEPPTTIDEWERALIGFRDEFGADAPFSLPGIWLLNSSNAIVSAFETTRGFFQEDGVVKYGPIEPGYRDFLELWARWYEEGLLDPDFASIDYPTFEAKLTSGRTGAYLQTVGGGMGRYLSLMENEPETFELIGVQYPTLEEGELAWYGHQDFPYTPAQSVAISASSDAVETAARFLDYAYGQEGHMLMNFGIEGESYEMVDGFPTYTDLITDNPEGRNLPEMLSRYTRASTGGPFVQDGRYMMQYLPREVQVDAVNAWTQADTSRRMPPVTPTPEESSQFASIMSEVSTYTNEMFLRFVTGVESLDNFDEYVERVRSLGIDEAIAIQQAALERFNAR